MESSKNNEFAGAKAGDTWYIARASGFRPFKITFTEVDVLASGDGFIVIRSRDEGSRPEMFRSLRETIARHSMDAAVAEFIRKTKSDISWAKDYLTELHDKLHEIERMSAAPDACSLMLGA